MFRKTVNSSFFAAAFVALTSVSLFILSGTALDAQAMTGNGNTRGGRAEGNGSTRGGKSVNFRADRINLLSINGEGRGGKTKGTGGHGKVATPGGGTGVGGGLAGGSSSNGRFTLLAENGNSRGGKRSGTGTHGLVVNLRDGGDVGNG